MNSDLIEKMRQIQSRTNMNVRFKNLSPGWRIIGGRRIFFRSRWEANYARYLQMLLEAGKIKRWDFEKKVFWFTGIKRGTTNYKPDFEIEEATGRIVYAEIKGYMDAKSRTKLKRMKIYFPETIVYLVEKDWFKITAPKFMARIKDWEHEKA